MRVLCGPLISKFYRNIFLEMSVLRNLPSFPFRWLLKCFSTKQVWCYLLTEQCILLCVVVMHTTELLSEKLYSTKWKEPFARRSDHSLSGSFKCHYILLKLNIKFSLFTLFRLELYQKLLHSFFLYLRLFCFPEFQTSAKNAKHFSTFPNLFIKMTLSLYIYM